ncbi:MAG: ATP-binding cassette domain-containing protein, partial [Anaerolineae bacterium]|nr:ATP-binding cassette domain-containing protein [Anaerolineae bacterium]
MSERLVEMQDIYKSFGRVKALNGVDFHVDKGEIVGLLGDNGAGKSTLIKTLTGVHTPTSGQIFFEGQPVTISSPHVARELGIETVYQDFALVPLMSIARNFWLGREPTRRLGPFKLLDLKRMAAEAHVALMDVGIHIRDAGEEVGKMSGGERQSIAIGRAVYFGKKLLILDEPTSALSVGETRKVMEYTRAAKAKGMGVIFISHNIGQVHDIADRFTIISHGRKVGDFYK